MFAKLFRAARAGRPSSETWTLAAACVAAALAGFFAVDDYSLRHRPPPRVVVAARAPVAPAPLVLRHADFGEAQASADAHRLADWATTTGDHGGRIFAIIDKAAAMLYVFAPSGHLIGASTILVGFARGDDSVPGVGTRKMADIAPQERTTPAGRFVARPGVNAGGEHIVWVDYEDAVSMHSVRATVPSERRLQRLKERDPKEHRISWGCINVPAAFFAAVAGPSFREPGGIIYVLPETRPLDVTFPRVDELDALTRATPAA